MTETLAAPMASTVTALLVEAGDEVRAGQIVAVVDVMKMEHQLTLPMAGTISAVHVAVGDLLARGQAVVSFDAVATESSNSADDAMVDLDAVPAGVRELYETTALTSDEHRAGAVAKRRSRGQRTARENVADLCDPDTFVEYGQLAVAAQRGQRPLDELRGDTAADGIITGIGRVAGRSVAVLAVDATVIAGTQGFWHHQKIDRILDVAARDELPVVFFPEGGGGRPYDPDTTAVFTAGLHITSFAAFAALSGKVPLVAIVSGRCFAGSAAFAGCADVIIATENANLGMAGPAMIEGGGMGIYEPEQVGPMSVQTENGTIDVLVADEAAAVVAARRYLGYFAAVGADETTAPSDQRLLRHLLPDNRRLAYAMRPVIETLFDTDSLLELRSTFGPAAITALGRLGGRPVGVVASDPLHQAGAIGPQEADKLARFFQLCDAHGLPIISLCDTPGFMVGPAVEEAAHVRHVSRLFVGGAVLTVPILGVIVRKAYGLGAMAMLGGGLHAPRLTVAWPTGEIGGMGFEGAVNLGMKNKLEAIDDPAEREAAFRAAVDKLYERGRALTSAAHLEFDAVIDPADTRRSLVAALAAAHPVGRGDHIVDPW